MGKKFTKNRKSSDKHVSEPMHLGKTDKRRGKGLLGIAVGARARFRYDNACTVFVEFCKLNRHMEVALFVERRRYLEPDQIRLLDKTLSSYFELAYESDPADVSSESLRGVRIFAHHNCSELLCGISDRFPECAKALPRANRSLVAWGREKQPNRAPPFPLAFVFALIGWALSIGLGSFALGIVCMFSGLLRPGEFFNLQVQDVVVGPTGVVLSLWDTKTTRLKAAAECAQIKCPRFTQIVSALLPMLPGLIWTRSVADFRDTFNDACLALGLVSFKFRLYSLRRGGATYLHEVIGMDRLLERGRWQSTKTARVYLDDARAHLATFKLTVQAQAQHHRHLHFLAVRFGW